MYKLRRVNMLSLNPLAFQEVGEFKNPAELITFYESKTTATDRACFGYQVIMPNGTGMPVPQFIHETTTHAVNLGKSSYRTV